MRWGYAALGVVVGVGATRWLLGSVPELDRKITGIGTSFRSALTGEGDPADWTATDDWDLSDAGDDGDVGFGPVTRL